MAKPICVGELHDYTDKDGTIWTVKVLSSRVMSYLMGLIGGAAEKAGDWGDLSIELVRWGLAGVQNFGDLKLETVSSAKFGKPENVVSDRFLDRIPMATIVELGGEILRLNVPQEGELKNSDSQPSLQRPSPTARSVTPTGDERGV